MTMSVISLKEQDQNWRPRGGRCQMLMFYLVTSPFKCKTIKTAEVSTLNRFLCTFKQDGLPPWIFQRAALPPYHHGAFSTLFECNAAETARDTISYWDECRQWVVSRLRKPRAAVGFCARGSALALRGI